MLQVHNFISIRETRPVFLIVGASVRPLVQSACRAGVPVAAADYFADWDTNKSCGGDNVSKLSRYDDVIDLITPSTEGVVYAGGVENRPELIAAWSSCTRILGCDAEAVRSVRDPFAVSEFLKEQGHIVPEISRIAPTKDRESWLVKPFHSVGGQNIKRLSLVEETADQRVYYQRHIPGIPIGCSFLCNGTETQLVGVCRLTTRKTVWSDFGYAGAVGPIELDNERLSQAREIGRSLARRFNLIGWFGVDMIMNDEGFWSLEVNPRYTSSMEILERASRLSFFQFQLDSVNRKELPRIDLDYSKIYGKRVIYNESDSSIVVTQSEFDRMRALYDANSVESKVVTDIPHPLTEIAPGSPICTWWACGDGITSVASSLDQSEQEWSNAFYSDVGTG